jgi:hypothetical protein
MPNKEHADDCISAWLTAIAAASYANRRSEVTVAIPEPLLFGVMVADPEAPPPSGAVTDELRPEHNQILRCGAQSVFASAPRMRGDLLASHQRECN